MPVLTSLRPELVPLNRHAAEVLLHRLGVSCIPALLDRDLKRHDVRYALFCLLKKVGIPWGEMHQPEKRRVYLARLREAVTLIVKVEKEARETSLSPEPVFDELGRSLASAERLSYRYSRVAAVMRVVMETTAIFPIHQRFQESLKEELERWPHISDATLAEGLEIHGTYKLLQSKFERTEAELSAMTSRLLPLVESKAEDLADILRKIINQHEALVAAIYSDEIEPGEGLERLDTLLADCEAIAESIEEPRERHCRILGVGPEATPAQIKRAYRRLRSKCREAFGLDPDPEAENRFIEVTKAYKALMAMHIHEEHCHV